MSHILLYERILTIPHVSSEVIASKHNYVYRAEGIRIVYALLTYDSQMLILILNNFQSSRLSNLIILESFLDLISRYRGTLYLQIQNLYYKLSTCFLTYV